MPQSIPEIDKQVYAMLDDLAEGAHRAFKDSDMYSDWIEDYTEKFLALITKREVEARIDELGKLNGTTLKWADIEEEGNPKNYYYKMGDYIDDRLAYLKSLNGGQDE